jgi:aryl-alcohol dehydrogenase-like predicted oxidoreductase
MMKDWVSVDEAGLRTVREVVAMAKELGVTAAQVALAWLRHRSVPVIPIIGARKLTQLEDNLKSLEISFSLDQLQRLDKVSAVPMGFPHVVLDEGMSRTITFGGMRDRIKA